MVMSMKIDVNGMKWLHQCKGYQSQISESVLSFTLVYLGRDRLTASKNVFHPFVLKCMIKKWSTTLAPKSLVLQTPTCEATKPRKASHYRTCLLYDTIMDGYDIPARLVSTRHICRPGGFGAQIQFSLRRRTCSSASVSREAAQK
ncbi:hypothetical protein L596_024691 [Steinernema carpocapsae]|uniref:Uncharacterized protein n=1 Tax=Steinernema carpocapsae TaxID=34508 RepID=A0A4U5M5G4_STECR|nr:hypothetical protein L596_024691 [Steinernema carpocapsae]